MGHQLVAILKTLIVVILIGSAIIASFYFAYVLIVLLVVGVVGTIAYCIFNRKESIDWYDYKDDDF